MVRPLWKAVWFYLKKLKVKLLYDPAIPLLRIYLKKPKTPVQKNMCTLMFIAVLLIIVMIWKQLKWIKKLWYIYTTEYYLAIKKKDILPFETP